MPRRADRRRIYAKRYKTDLCRTFQESGFCPYGANCLFAHGAEEMRSQELNVNEGLTVDVISRISRQKIREAHHLNSSTPDKTPTRPAPAHRTVSSNQLPSAATSSRANTTDAERDSDSQSSLRHASSWPTTTTTVSGDFMRRDSAADVASRARTALRLLWKSTSRHLASTEVPSIAGARGPRRDPYVSVNV